MMSLHRERTHPEFVEGCDACRWASVDLNYQSFDTRDHVRGNMSRTQRILKQRAERRDSLTDLRYGRRVDAATERAALHDANIDGNRVRLDG